MRDKIVVTLNEALALDPNAITKLLHTRVLVNNALADHPKIMVHQPDPISNDPNQILSYELGFLGILNALVDEPIKAELSTDSHPWRIIRFV